MKIGMALTAAVCLAAGATGAQAETGSRAQVHATMNSVFGVSRWRETGGYRTPERENELRAQGALTVPPGVLSKHSMGGPESPGAYDLVVMGMSPWEAAARLRQAGAPFAKIFPEGAYGGQGAHLHVEPGSPARASAGFRRPGLAWTVSDPSPAQLVFNRLHDAALGGDGEAQLKLGELYADGGLEAQDRVAAYVWTAMAAANETAEPPIRKSAEDRLSELSRVMKPEDVRQAARFAPTGQAGASGGASACDVQPGAVGGLRLLVVDYEPTPASTQQRGCLPSR